MKRKTYQSNINLFAEIASKKAKQPAMLELPYDLITHNALNFLLINDKVKLLQTSSENQRIFNPHIDTCRLLQLIVNGQANSVKAMIKAYPVADRSKLLKTPGNVTDFSGRIFTNIMPYDYPYWVGDWHMCETLISLMNTDEIDENVHKRKDAIDKNGVTYQQRGEIKTSSHFSLTPLKKAYADYFNAYNSAIRHMSELNYTDLRVFSGLSKQLSAIGNAQSDLPVYIIQEFNRPERNFASVPNFDEPNLSRDLVHCYNVALGLKIHCDWRALIIDKSFQPLPSLDGNRDWNNTPQFFVSGDKLALARGDNRSLMIIGSANKISMALAGEYQTTLKMDLAALTRLDEVRGLKIQALHEQLSPSSQGLRR